MKESCGGWSAWLLLDNRLETQKVPKKKVATNLLDNVLEKVASQLLDNRLEIAL